MADSTEENTRWIEVWALNDPDFYFDAVSKAREGSVALKTFVVDALMRAVERDDESTAACTGREMSLEDYERVDWDEVASTLLDGQ